MCQKMYMEFVIMIINVEVLKRLHYDGSPWAAHKDPAQAVNSFEC